MRRLLARFVLWLIRDEFTAAQVTIERDAILAIVDSAMRRGRLP